MNKIVLFIYDSFKRRPGVAVCICVLLTLGMILSTLSLHYKEDISDFLPLDGDNRTAMSIYQEISGANNIYAIISASDSTKSDPETLAEGMELFASRVEEADSTDYISEMMTQVDMDKMSEIADFIYNNIPYFLTDADYQRMDSLLSTPNYIDTRIAADKEMLLFPSSSMIADNISQDPLGLFSHVMDRLGSNGMDFNFDTYDGYILSPDSKRAIAVLKSSFGAQESDNNAKLAAMLQKVSDDVSKENPNISIHLIGGPTIAVANADRIKKDSILAIALAGTLILALLIYVFRNARNLLLIFVSVGWGWLFAMAIISLFYDSISVIVIGIASVMLGIAVNYPLHLIDHLKDSSKPRQALKEIIAPLIVGNITTIGAFLCLVPLNAPALHDLGLFSSLLLAGTIIFVLVFLPHAVKTREKGEKNVPEPIIISKIAGISFENHPIAIVIILCLTAVFAYFSLQTEFDTDMRHINYMTAEQHADMDYFQSLAGNDKDTEHIYVASSAITWEEALIENEKTQTIIDSLKRVEAIVSADNASDFIISKEKQKERIKQWNDFITRHKESLTTGLEKSAANNGFNPLAFSPFNDIVNTDFEIRDFEYFSPLADTVFSSSVSDNAAGKSFIRHIDTKKDKLQEVKNSIESAQFGGLCFDVASMNGAIANTLSNDFNYIGIACGCIVFFFLWLSLGSIELALMSFLPMAISWIWILGIMAILGIKFNIVNIILATFIFGQGDDYTIFITEGLTYEFAYRRKLLASYKNSIIISALIMFIGIGTLLFAQHPAMRSLGEVTVVGMFSVVLMAYLFPPLVFKYLVYKNGKRRIRPLTLSLIVKNAFRLTVFYLEICLAFIYRLLLLVFVRADKTSDSPQVKLDRRGHLMQKFLKNAFTFNLRHLYAKNVFIDTEFSVDSVNNVICLMKSDGYSLCGIMAFISIVPKPAFTDNAIAKLPNYMRKLLNWTDIPILHFESTGKEDFYNIYVCPELFSPYDSADSALRDDMPVIFHIRKTATPHQGYDCMNLIDINTGYMQINPEISDIVIKKGKALTKDRFLYKGAEIAISVKRRLNRLKNASFNSAISHDGSKCNKLVISAENYGENALHAALLNPRSKIYCTIQEEDKRALLRVATEGFLNNLHICSETKSTTLETV